MAVVAIGSVADAAGGCADDSCCGAMKKGPVVVVRDAEDVVAAAVADAAVDTVAVA